jgi:hypothetical protein
VTTKMLFITTLQLLLPKLVAGDVSQKLEICRMLQLTSYKNWRFAECFGKHLTKVGDLQNASANISQKLEICRMLQQTSHKN